MQKQFLRIKKTYEKEIVVIDDTIYYAHFNRGEWRDKYKADEVSFYRDSNKIYCKVYFQKTSFKLDNLEHRLISATPNWTFYGEKILDIKFQVKIADTWVNFTKEYVPIIVFDPYRDCHYAREDYLHLIAPNATHNLDKELCDKYQKEKIKERIANNEKREIKDKEIKKRELEEKAEINRQKQFMEDWLKNSYSPFCYKLLLLLKTNPRLFRACQGFLDNESDKTKENLHKALKDISNLSDFEKNYFKDNTRKMLEDIIKIKNEYEESVR